MINVRRTYKGLFFNGVNCFQFGRVEKSVEALPQNFKAGNTGVRRFITTSTDSIAPKEWEASIRPAIDQVNTQVLNAIEDLRSLSSSGAHTVSNSALWEEAFQVVRRIANSPKKHLFRPQLTILGYASKTLNRSDIGSSCPSPVIQFAAGVELQHLFMLIHDDMMDNANFRRGEDTMQVALSRAGSDTTNKKIDRRSIQYLSTIIGDLLLAKSFEMMFKASNDVGSPHALEPIYQGTYRVGAAQFQDIVGWNAITEKNDRSHIKPSAGAGKESKSSLGRLLHDKAAYHGFVAPLVAGLQLAKSKPQLDNHFVQVCTRWGFHAGAAFQGMDDVADLTCSPSETGKDQLQDIQECRLSLPLLKLHEKASEREWTKVKEILTKRTGSALAISDRQFLLQLIRQYRLIQVLFDFIDGELEEAENIVRNELTSPASETLSFGLKSFNQGLRNVKDSLREKTW